MVVNIMMKFMSFAEKMRGRKLPFYNNHLKVGASQVLMVHNSPTLKSFGTKLCHLSFFSLTHSLSLSLCLFFFSLYLLGHLRAAVDLDGADLLEVSLHDVGALEHELAALALEVLLFEDSDPPLSSLIHHLLLVHDGHLSLVSRQLKKGGIKNMVSSEC